MLRIIAFAFAAAVAIVAARAEERALVAGVFEPKVGEAFRDCSDCPEMVVVPAGSFMMGSPASEPKRSDNEQQHNVTIPKAFAVGKYAVTFAEWDACVADGGCEGYKPWDRGWGRGDRPVINVSWDDAQVYVKWLSKKTGKSYRLPSEAEREYFTRAGTDTTFWWGSSITQDLANYGRPPHLDSTGTVPVMSFKPNPWGLYQVHGNVWEWTQDCWNDNYNDAPADGSARTTENCAERVVRGGSWYYFPWLLRAAYRNAYTTGYRNIDVGFRVARTLNPAS